MRRKSSAADGHSESPTELIARISAEHDSPSEDTGRHRRAAVVTSGAPSTRTLTRRLAPLAVGAAVMLVAATVVAFVRPVEDQAVAAPDLNSAFLAGAPTTTPAPAVATLPATPSAVAAPPSSAAAPAPTTTVKKKVAAPAAAPKPVRAAAQSAGDGVQAAAAQGWTRSGGDEFTNGLSGMWVPYEGAGHNNQGTRTRDAISVANGVMTIRGDGNGNTGGMSWNEEQRFGKWEMRARFPKGDVQYHPVLLLWPNGEWPAGGEVDFAETTSASDEVSFFLHYSASNQQKYANQNIDLTQWHNYAVEWVDGRITGYIDGKQWFESTDGATMPPDKMHAAIQLDYFPEGGSPQPSEMQVDYVRIYK